MTLVLGLIGFFSVYLLVDIGRLVKRQLRKPYRWRAFLQTALWLLCLQLAVILIDRLAQLNQVAVSGLVHTMASLQVLCSLAILAASVKQLKRVSPRLVSDSYTDKQLPTLTVCIPARNETNDLDTCLQSLVSSNYPKLEILVLDDCSQNRRTPEIIRSFAQSGVRFIAGEAPPDRWLAKNYAYYQLSNQANGELLLFCGVDARFTPTSLRSLVTAMLQQQKTMISLLPRNQAPSAGDTKSLLIQPLRYAWELALPRNWLTRPPVLSTCWVIKSQALEAAGGFAAVSRKVVPESYFARHTAAEHNGYSFMAAGAEIGLSSSKNFAEQLATAVRTRYPQLHRRPEVTALVSLAALCTLVLPFTMLLAALAAGWWSIAILCAISCLLLTSSHALIVRLTYRRFLWRSLWLLPFAALFDIGLLNYSMLKYEFGQVLWKGRNICLPVMRIT